jgi:tetratricopeptide (TPR) repeat protein
MTKVILNSLQPKLLKWGKAVFWTATILLCFSSTALAVDEKPKPQEPVFNPLEIKKPDPLLPQMPKRGNVSPEVQETLRPALDELDTQATELFKAKRADEAFEVWYRELRLRRALGRVEEVRALGRVGELAWQENRKFDSQVIAKRLLEIQTEAEKNKVLNLELLQALGQTYRQVRLLEPASEVYEKILTAQEQQGDTVAQEETRKLLAQLYVERFKYPEAAKYYKILLEQAQARGDRVNELAYLQQLVYVYSKAQQPENALRAKQDLAATFPLNDARLPALKIAIAGDYEAIGQKKLAIAADYKTRNQPTDASKHEEEAYADLDRASQTYQEAYKQAWALQQWAYASEALSKLAALYRSSNQPDSALQVYDVLLKTQQQSYNFYGLMNTYDQMGQIYLAQGKYSQALDVFQKGLELAKSLQYQENYFSNQIDRISKQSLQ